MGSSQCLWGSDLIWFGWVWFDGDWRLRGLWGGLVDQTVAIEQHSRKPSYSSSCDTCWHCLPALNFRHYLPEQVDASVLSTYRTRSFLHSLAPVTKTQCEQFEPATSQQILTAAHNSSINLSLYIIPLRRPSSHQICDHLKGWCSGSNDPKVSPLKRLFESSDSDRDMILRQSG